MRNDGKTTLIWFVHTRNLQPYEVRMAERSKALRSGRSLVLQAWVRIPLLTYIYFFFLSIDVQGLGSLVHNPCAQPSTTHQLDLTNKTVFTRPFSTIVHACTDVVQGPYMPSCN